MNTFMNQLSNDFNYKRTENGALAHRTTNSAVYDMFAMGAAYRSRSDEDCILLFKNAYEENPTLALKCLFYIRDCRGGQGERRFFRTCFRWLAENKPARARNLVEYLPEYGRYDDWFELFGTPVEDNVMELIRYQLMTDMASEKNGISLLAKWMPSENASSRDTIAKAHKIRNYLHVTSKQYRQMLSRLRKKINVLERLMSANEWDKIEFDKIPSRAGMIYRNAFARRDIIAKKYESFAKDKNTKVNAKTLYPYEVVAKAVAEDRHSWYSYAFKCLDDTERAMINKYWDNLEEYIDPNKKDKILCMVDTSGSMTGSAAAAPMNVAISLGLYCAERANGPFKNHYISFSSRPQLIKIEGVDFVDKVRRIYKTNLCENTNLTAAFDLLLKIAKRPGVRKEDIPETIIVLSDMEIDQGTRSGYWSSSNNNRWTKETTSTEMEKMRQKWASYGFKLPRLIYWNLNARSNTILDAGPNVSFVSGMSPVLFKRVLSGKNGYELMLETICSDRYKNIH